MRSLVALLAIGIAAHAQLSMRRDGDQTRSSRNSWASCQAGALALKSSPMQRPLKKDKFSPRS
jgi:hypothetical protein